MTKTECRLAPHKALLGGLLAVLLVGVCQSAFAISGIIVTTDGRQLPFDRIDWRQRDKSYDYVPRGAGQVVSSISARQVRGIRVATPAAMKQAMASVRGGQATGAAISTLNRVVQQYIMLGPDLEAGRWLARAYNSSGQPEKAVEICETVAEGRTQSQLSWGFIQEWWDGLLKTGKTDELERRLEDAIREGNGEVQAVAHIKLGDLMVSKGKHRDALVDGYLRTIILFGGNEELQPEALYKAIKSFEQVGEVQNGEKLRKKLLAEYPEAPYSRRLQSEG